MRNERQTQLSASQCSALAMADEGSRVLVTTIDGRVAMILPPIEESEQADWILRVAQALDAAGIGTVSIIR